MKKVIRGLIVTVIAMSTMTGAASAQAVDPCAGQGNATITNTGPGSNNTITCTNNVTTTFTCINGVLINNINGQAANSGNANNSGNTTGGGATTGQALNNNQTTTDINASCAGAVTTPTAVTPAGGQGAGPAPVAPAAVAPAAVSVKALPNTGSNNLLMQAGIGALVLGAAAAAMQLALTAYRRSGN